MHTAIPMDAGTAGVLKVPKRSGGGGCAAHTTSSAKRNLSMLEKTRLRSNRARCCLTRKRLTIHMEILSRAKYTCTSESVSFIFLKKSHSSLLFMKKVGVMDIKHQSVFLRQNDGTWGLDMRSRSESNASSHGQTESVVVPSQTAATKQTAKRTGRKKKRKKNVADTSKVKKRVKQCKKTDKPDAQESAGPGTGSSAGSSAGSGTGSGTASVRPPKVFRRRKRKARKAKEVAKMKILSGVNPKVLAPATTKSAKTTKPRMQSVNAETTPEILQMEGGLVPSEATVEAETQNLNRINSTAGFDAYLEAEIHHLLDNSTHDQFCLETDPDVDQLREDLPRFTRKDENAMLIEVSPRSPYACEMGRSCESIKMSTRKGISPPIVLGAVRKEGFSEYKQCLLCLRNSATATLLRLRMDRVGMVRDGCLQTHANYCNINGEYRKEDCLPVRRDRYEGIVLPIVAHRNSGYQAKELRNSDGKKTRFWCQKEGYPCPTMSITAASGASDGAAAEPPAPEKGSFLLKESQTKAMI